MKYDSTAQRADYFEASRRSPTHIGTSDVRKTINKWTTERTNGCMNDGYNSDSEVKQPGLA